MRTNDKHKNKYVLKWAISSQVPKVTMLDYGKGSETKWIWV
jgi:hypothetical protein